jgi:hypothetical protein
MNILPTKHTNARGEFINTIFTRGQDENILRLRSCASDATVFADSVGRVFPAVFRTGNRAFASDDNAVDYRDERR